MIVLGAVIAAACAASLKVRISGLGEITAQGFKDAIVRKGRPTTRGIVGRVTGILIGLALAATGLALTGWSTLGPVGVVSGLKITNADIVENHAYCPVSITATGSIYTLGGADRITYAFQIGSEQSRPVTKHITANGSHAVIIRNWPVQHGGAMRLVTMEPGSRLSSPQQISVNCRPVPGSYQRFVSAAFETVYPDGWTVVEQDQPHNTFNRTKLQPPQTPGDPYWIVIDREYNDDTVAKPHDLGDGYKLLVWRRVQLPGQRKAKLWRYRLGGHQRIHFQFILHGRNGPSHFAVMGQGSDVQSLMAMVRTVAASIREAPASSAPVSSPPDGD
jgi:hypothetical protein